MSCAAYTHYRMPEAFAGTDEASRQGTGVVRLRNVLVHPSMYNVLWFQWAAREASIRFTTSENNFQSRITPRKGPHTAHTCHEVPVQVLVVSSEALHLGKEGIHR